MSKHRRTREPKTEPSPAPIHRHRNAGQIEAAELFREFDVLFLLGPAGTGKTHAAVSLALNAERVIITRPAVELDGERLGYLPGGPDEKLHPFMLPVLDVLRTQLGIVEAGKAFKRFEVCPLAFIRGRTLDHCVAILDEAQNATRAQRKTYLTRLGRNGKMIISGDPSQSDIRGGKAFIEEVDELVRAKVAGVVRFDQSMQQRSVLLEGIENVYAKLG